MIFTSGLKISLPQAPDYTRRAKFSKISASQGASLVSMTLVVNGKKVRTQGF
jgi:hypothetical protein